MYVTNIYDYAKFLRFISEISTGSLIRFFSAGWIITWHKNVFILSVTHFILAIVDPSFSDAKVVQR